MQAGARIRRFVPVLAGCLLTGFCETMTMIDMSAADLARSVKFNRPVRNVPMTLFSVMRNEMFFLPAFLEHYRRLGIAQFVIVDDASDDSTAAYLSQQPDCCFGTSHIRFGERIRITDPSYGGLAGRSGPMLKRVVPEQYLHGQYVLIADADEFLLLPDACPTVAHVVGLLESRGWTSAAASLIDFYPEALEDLADPLAPRNVGELFSRYGYFDAVPFVSLVSGRPPQKTGSTASERLFRECGIRDVPIMLDVLPRAIANRLPFRTPVVAWYKTPIIKYDGRNFLDGSHDGSVPPPTEVLLAMAHFKFNGDTYRKIQFAIERKSYARKGRKYENYEQMLQVMQQRRLGFLSACSKRYASPEQMLSEGMCWLPV